MSDGPLSPEAFALLRFAAVLAAPEVALVEVEGRLGSALQRRRGLPRLLLEDGGGRIELAAVPGASVVQDDVLRVTFAAPAEVSEEARWTLALRDVLVELPTPDVPPGPERHIALARELNGLRHRLRAAEEHVAGAEAAQEAARAQGLATAAERVTAAEEARRAAEARTGELQAAASARDADLRREGDERVAAARAEGGHRVEELEAALAAERERGEQRIREAREEADRAGRAVAERADRADASVAEVRRERDAAQAEAVAARARTREATRLLKAARAELAEARGGVAAPGDDDEVPAARARAAASPLGAVTAAARSEQDAQDAEDAGRDDAGATRAFDATERADADADADADAGADAAPDDDATYETPAPGPRPSREDTYESPALDVRDGDTRPRPADGRGWTPADPDGPSDTVRVLGRDRPRASALPPPPDADVPPPPFLARWGAPIALGLALLILLVILVGALL